MRPELALVRVRQLDLHIHRGFLGKGHAAGGLLTRLRNSTEFVKSLKVWIRPLFRIPSTWTSKPAVPGVGLTRSVKRGDDFFIIKAGLIAFGRQVADHSNSLFAWTLRSPGARRYASRRSDHLGKSCDNPRKGQAPGFE